MAVRKKQRTGVRRPSRIKTSCRLAVLRLESLEARVCPSTSRVYDPNGELTQITQTGSGPSPVSDVWNYAPHPTLTSITQTQNNGGGSTTSIAWNYPVNSTDSVTQTDTNADGSSEDFLWKSGFVSETDRDSKGNITLEIQIVYNNDGSVGSITQQQNNSNGSSVATEWDYGTNGLNTVSQKNYDANGAVSQVQTWNYGGNNLSFYQVYFPQNSGVDEEVVVNTDGSIVVGSWWPDGNPAFPIGYITVDLDHPDGSVNQQQVWQSDGSGNWTDYEKWGYANNVWTALAGWSSQANNGPLPVPPPELFSLPTSSTPGPLTTSSATGGITATSYQVTIQQPPQRQQGIGPAPVAPVPPTEEWVETNPPPNPVVPGQQFSIAFSAEGEDGTVDASYNGSATVAITPDAAGGAPQLFGSPNVQVVNGVVNFNVAIKVLGTYTFTVTSPEASGIGAVTSDLFDVATHPAPKLTVIAPSRPYNGQPFAPTLIATGTSGQPVNGSSTATYYAGSSVSGAPLATAPTDDGTYTAVVAFASTDPNYSNAVSKPATFSITPSPNELYVTAVYKDVLGRAVDDSGLAYWVRQIDIGTPISSVAASIAHSDEYYANFVIRPDYLKLLGRAADQAGVIYWTKQMDAGLTDQQLEAQFVASDEFFANAGGTNVKWIDAIYQLLLGREADASGESYWTGQLKSGVSRQQVAEDIAGSTENNTLLINSDYFHYLGRAADPGGLVYWLGQFTAGKTNEDVIAGFTGSAEYYQKNSAIPG